MIDIKHVADPSALKNNYQGWPFIYVHGEAEDVQQEMCVNNGWDWQPPDLILASTSIPEEPGEYIANHYGRKLIVVLDYGPYKLITKGPSFKEIKEICLEEEKMFDKLWKEEMTKKEQRKLAKQIDEWTEKEREKYSEYRLQGRASYEDDVHNLQHCRTPKNWR